MDTPTVPTEFIKLASEWHGGQSSMMYAIASTGNLKPGTHRPYNTDDGRPMSDIEWIRHLYGKLYREILEILRFDGAEAIADRAKMVEFCNWVQKTLDILDAE